MDPRGTVGRIYIEDRYTLLHTKYESSGLAFGSGELKMCPERNMNPLPLACSHAIH